MKVTDEIREFLEQRVSERRASLVKENQIRLANQIFVSLEKRYPEGIPNQDLINFCDLCDRTEK